jgi:hypothetical protein
MARAVEFDRPGMILDPSGVPVAAYPVPGPLDVLGGSDAGARSRLKGAAMKALNLSRSRCR